MDLPKPLTKKETIIIGGVLVLCGTSLVTLFVLFGFEILNTAFNKGQ